jgi:hypothetical protein
LVYTVEERELTNDVFERVEQVDEQKPILPECASQLLDESLVRSERPVAVARP